MKVRDLAAHAQEEITGFYLVHQKEMRANKTGDSYISMMLGDETGSVDARQWDNIDQNPDFGAGDVVKIKGRVQLYRNRVQLSVMQLRATREGEATPADFQPRSTRDPGEMFAELQGIVASITQPHLRQLLEAIFNDQTTASKFQRAPAARSMHHAFRGGLLEHVLSICGMCEAAAKHYGAAVRRDLLICGALLHDIGKIDELGYEGAFHYTGSGQLVGHLVQGVEMVREKIRALPGFPAEYALLIEHMILSHHGHLEFGSPKEPVFPEALLLHFLDDLDSKMEAMRATLAASPDQEWTARCPALDRSLLNVNRFLDSAESMARALDVAVK